MRRAWRVSSNTALSFISRRCTCESLRLFRRQFYLSPATVSVYPPRGPTRGSGFVQQRQIADERCRLAAWSSAIYRYVLCEVFCRTSLFFSRAYSKCFLFNAFCFINVYRLSDFESLFISNSSTFGGEMMSNANFLSCVKMSKLFPR